MDINQISLHPAALQGLYKSHLVDPGPTGSAGRMEQPPLTPEISTTDIRPAPDTKPKYLGENKKGILILVNNKETVLLPDEELRFLTGILHACRLSLADTAVCNLHSSSVKDYRELGNLFHCKEMLLFGAGPADIGLPLHFPDFQNQEFNGVRYLAAPALSALEKDRTLKTKLWTCLKLLFNL